MLERSIEALEVLPQDQLIIISQKEHSLPAHYPNLVVDWIELIEETSGQLDTFMRSFDLIQHDRVVIFNCDTYFKANGLRLKMDNDLIDGLVTCSRQPGENWSFCLVDQDYLITDIAEKKRISDWASVGHYYFKDKNLLRTLAKEELSNTDVSEHYVAPLYKKYLLSNKKISMVVAEEFCPFGSIEQIRNYWSLGLEELEAENI